MIPLCGRALGLVLFFFLMIINVVFTWVSKKGVGEGET